MQWSQMENKSVPRLAMAVLLREIVFHQNWGRQLGPMFLALARHRLGKLINCSSKEDLWECRQVSSMYWHQADN